MSNDPADKLAAPSFGFKKKRGGAKPAKAKSEATQTKARPEAAEPEAAPAETTPAETTQPETTQPETAEPETAPLEKTQSETTPLETTQSASAQGEKTQVLEKAAPPVVEAEPPAEKAPKKQKAQKPARKPKAPKPPKEPKQPKDPSQPRLNIGKPTGLSAAVMIGAIVGAFMALAIWFSGTVSQWTRGTSSLGDSGVIILVAVFALAVIVGGYLLRLASARSPFTISFLGSALVAVLSMLFLTDVFNHAWGVIVVVILTAATYALAHWVTTNYID